MILRYLYSSISFVLNFPTVHGFALNQPRHSSLFIFPERIRIDGKSLVTNVTFIKALCN